MLDKVGIMHEAREESGIDSGLGSQDQQLSRADPIRIRQDGLVEIRSQLSVKDVVPAKRVLVALDIGRDTASRAA
jgi:hypothetical protein